MRAGGLGWIKLGQSHSTVMGRRYIADRDRAGYKRRLRSIEL